MAWERCSAGVGISVEEHGGSKNCSQARYEEEIGKAYRNRRHDAGSHRAKDRADGARGLRVVGNSARHGSSNGRDD